MMRMAGGGWVYAAKLTLEDATGCVDAHLFADDGAEFFQVRMPPCHWFPRSAAFHLEPKCVQTGCATDPCAARIPLWNQLLHMKVVLYCAIPVQSRPEMQLDPWPGAVFETDHILPCWDWPHANPVRNSCLCRTSRPRTCMGPAMRWPRTCTMPCAPSWATSQTGAICCAE